MYELTCPGCGRVDEAPFVRVGAVVTCASCTRRFRATAEQVERRVTLAEGPLETAGATKAGSGVSGAAGPSGGKGRGKRRGAKGKTLPGNQANAATAEAAEAEGDAASATGPVEPEVERAPMPRSTQRSEGGLSGEEDEATLPIRRFNRGPVGMSAELGGRPRRRREGWLPWAAGVGVGVLVLVVACWLALRVTWIESAGPGPVPPTVRVVVPKLDPDVPHLRAQVLRVEPWAVLPEPLAWSEAEETLVPSSAEGMEPLPVEPRAVVEAAELEAVEPGADVGRVLQVTLMTPQIEPVDRGWVEVWLLNERGEAWARTLAEVSLFSSRTPQNLVLKLPPLGPLPPSSTAAGDASRTGVDDSGVDEPPPPPTPDPRLRIGSRWYARGRAWGEKPLLRARLLDEGDTRTQAVGMGRQTWLRVTAFTPDDPGAEALTRRMIFVIAALDAAGRPVQRWRVQWEGVESPGRKVEFYTHTPVEAGQAITGWSVVAAATGTGS